MNIFFDIIIAYIIDLILGDPYRLPHPVRFIGFLIKKNEQILRWFVSRGTAKNKVRNEKIAGGLLTISITGSTFLIVLCIMKIANIIHPVAFHLTNIYFIYTSLATKCLANEAIKVYKNLKADNLNQARKSLSMLVGRQTENLNSQEVARGVIETVAENTVDGVISPLMYVVIGTFFGIGAPLVYAFKAVSTLDSMVGYKNEKYVNFGKVSARTDDVVNFIPARLSGMLIPLAALFCRLNFLKSLTIMLRDRRKHKSPNCAYPEAAFAGALGIKIGGNNIYFGTLVKKDKIGDETKIIDEKDIKKAIRLMYTTSIITLLVVISALFYSTL